MKKKNIHIFLFLFAHICFTYAQQINTDNSLNPQQLIQNLVGSNCFSASNITSSINGSVNNIISYGSFDRGTSNFPLQSGLILSTGSVISAGNTFMGEDLSEGEINWGSLEDIEEVLGIDRTLNTTSIEFDFVSVNNFVAFKYIFASDEYQQEYPCNFEDVFAILIKPAGSSDPYVNIALIPNLNTEVSTNTIHPNINGFCPQQNEAYFQGYNFGDTNFNGRTEVLTARSEVISGETYHVKFLIADHIDQRFDSAVFIEADSFGGAIDLGPDQSICGTDLLLNADVGNVLANYTWFLNGSEITGESNPTLQITQTGTYNVEIIVPLIGGTCTLGDSIEVEVIPFQEASSFEDIAVCDPNPSDGISEFDFLLKNDEILATLPSTNYIISYHSSQDTALNNIDPIIGTYQNTELIETIFVRIESLDGSCLQIGNFDIIVNLSPNIGELSSLFICNGYFLAGLSFEDISIFDFDVADFQFNRSVSFHFTENDAINNENEIFSSFDITEMQELIYAKIIDDFSGCVSITPISLIYLEGLNFENQNYVINKCSFQEFDVFDLNPIAEQVEAVFGEVNITFHTSFSDALVANNVLLFGTIVNQSPFFGKAYMRVTPQGSICGTVAEIDLFINLPRSLLGDSRTVSRCDDLSNDGVLDFYLSEIAEELSQGFDMDLNFYATENDQFFNSNPIDQNAPFQVSNYSQEIFVTANYEGCFNFSSLILNINDAFFIEPQTIDTCGEFNIDDGTTTIYLDSFVDLMNGDIIGTQVEFYNNEDDAINDENPLVNTFDVAGNSKEFFVRITKSTTQCYTIATLTVNITDNIEFNEPSPIIVCDNDLDGFATVNLESIITEILNDTNNLEITFYESLENAIIERLKIEDPENYTTDTREIFLRAERIGAECFNIINFDVLIFNNPQITSVSDLINCEINPNNPSDFFFINKDIEILNDQLGMDVLYFETQDDAINRNNPIDKMMAYQNTSNPQTIYIRLENEAENSCFTTTPLQIEVRQAPDFHQPTDLPVCGTNGDGPYTVDLNEKLLEISEGSTSDLNVTFHSTPLNANIGANPLPLSYTTTSNPETVYVRVLNSVSGCYNIVSFNINVLNLPEVNYGQSLIICGNNYETIFEWNLTDIELDILNGRQFSIEFNYFRSELDAENEINPIINPETYSNVNSLETIYVKVSNAVTGCFITVPFSITINQPPAINYFEVYNICDTTNSLNFSDINDVLLDNTFNVLVSYHANELDAEANINSLNNDYIYTNPIETIYARVEYSTTGCYTVYPFTLNVNPLPVANQPYNLIACDDDDDDVNGILQFDLSQQNTSVLNGQNPNDFSVSYFNSEINANENNEPLITDYLAYDGENIYVRLENNITGCYDITQFSIVVNPLPFAAIEDQVICLNNLPLIVSADTNNPEDTYLWSTNATSSEIEIIETGTYSVTITNQFGCENISAFSVTESESAFIDVVETIDFSDPNNITITVTGIGDYLYQLNNGPFQISNTFQNVPIGSNTITIIDQNGCARVTREVLVIDTPKHLTPNDDGDFDTWHITGVESLPGTIIYVFDRYGKLLAELNHNSLGWDGTYKGNKMPTGDYWFIAKVIQNGLRFEVKGHFALRR